MVELSARELGLLEDTRIVLHCVCDEETGSAVGSGHLRAAGIRIVIWANHTLRAAVSAVQA